MPFEKNHTKKGGRKAGQPNKTSKEIREAKSDCDALQSCRSAAASS